MGVFDEVSTRGREFSQKAKDLADITEMNGNIGKMQKHLEEMYSALGRDYYEHHKVELDAGRYQEYLDQIGRLQEQIARANTYVRELKNRNNIAAGKASKTCPDCGKVLEAEAMFCTKCGRSVKDVPTSDVLQARVQRTPQPDASVMVKKVDQHVDFLDEKLKKLEDDLSGQ